MWMSQKKNLYNMKNRKDSFIKNSHYGYRVGSICLFNLDEVSIVSWALGSGLRMKLRTNTKTNYPQRQRALLLSNGGSTS